MREAVVRLRGGLGNQLFQYAAARGLSESPLVLGYGGDWGAGHPTLSDVGIPITYPARRERTRWPGIAVRETWRDDVSASLATVIGKVTGTALIRQTDPFAPRPTDLPTGDLVLDGWFQHPDWWRGSWKAVAGEIRLREPASVADYRAGHPVVVKLRRSDYLANGWELDGSWLRSALRMLDISGCSVVLASEDPESIAFAAPILAEFGCTVASAPVFTGNPNLDDFWAIAGASTIVLANSSYCWWAAAVAQIGGEVDVACPEPWLPNAWGDGAVPSLALPGWTTVPTGFDVD